jgi:hypothetical protein
MPVKVVITPKGSNQGEDNEEAGNDSENEFEVL